MGWRCGTCGGENPEGMRFCGHCGAAADSLGDTPTSEQSVSVALKNFVSAQVAEKLVEGGGEMREERRMVTCLFADLSGFTPLADRLDPEELVDVIDPVITRLSEVVGRYEGYVDKFAGDALLAFFGAPVSHEDDADRALLVADEMHRELRNLLPELPEDAGDLTLHIGVNTGHVIARVLGSDVRMDYSVLGDAVILAQRLESAAPSGETYVGSATHALTRDRFELEAVGELTLKGKSEPVPAWRLRGPRRTRAALGRLVGREDELKRVDAVLKALRSGRGAVLSISGDAGVGKSRLVAEIRERLVLDGHRTLATRCLTYGSGIAYWPYTDLIRRMAGISHADSPDQARSLFEEALRRQGLAEATPYLARLAGLPAPELANHDPEDYRRDLHRAVSAAVRGMTAEGPLLLVVEDLHWADASSVALTADLARVTETAPVLLVVTARREAITVLLEIAAVAEESSRHAFQLEPLAGSHTRSLVDDLLGGRATEELVELVNERAVGNPFFAQELVRSLQDQGAIEEASDGWALKEGFDATQMPPTVEAVLAARMDRLPPDVSETLMLSAVIGRRVRLPILKQAAKPRDVEGDIKILVDVGFFDESDREGSEHGDEVAFHHSLMQDVAYSRLLRKHRRELHLRVAEVAEELYGAEEDTIDLLARHLHLAEAPKAVEYLTRAGDRAARLFANEEAVRHLEHAAELARKNNDPSLPEILLKIADQQSLRGNYEEALRLFTQVRDQTNDVRAWRGIAMSLRNRAEYDEALDVVMHALASLPDPERPPVLLEKGWTLSRLGRFPEAIESLSEGLVHESDGTTRGHLMLQLARSEALVGATQLGVAHAEEAILLFERAEDLKGLATALRIAGDAYRMDDRLEDAAAALRRGLELATMTGAAEERAGCLINLGVVEFELGAYDDAIARYTEAAEVFQELGIPTGQAIAYGNLADTLVSAGRFAEALDHGGRALELARSIGDMETVADVTKTVATARRVQGLASEAAAAAEEAAELYLQMSAIPSAAECFLLAASAYDDAGDTERARAARARAHQLEARKR